MIHIYTGNGKGKTTSAFGLGMRASGQSLKVIIFQFLKPKAFFSGEEILAKKTKLIKVVKFNQTHPMFEGSCSPKEAHNTLKETIKKDFEVVKKAIVSKKYDMVALDEIINVVDQKLIDRDNFLKLLKSVPPKTELILTGRGDTSFIEEYADYITVMIDKKHPFRKNKKARKGIEY
ncbi:cob(I)yrinic acid a,c-diamide adenosyltransferase [Candidatus Omnitrophota bacterium]